MNQDQVFGTLRILLPSVLSYAVGKGWISTSQVADVTAAILTIGGVIWSFFVHTDQGKVAAVVALPAKDLNIATAALPAQDKITMAAALPEVKNITTTKALADAIPSTKVTNGFVTPKP